MKQSLKTYSVPLGVIFWIVAIIFGYHFHWLAGVGAVLIPILIMVLLA